MSLTKKIKRKFKKKNFVVGGVGGSYPPAETPPPPTLRDVERIFKIGP